MKIQLEIPRSVQAYVYAVALRAADEDKAGGLIEVLDGIFDSDEPVTLSLDMFDDAEAKDAVRQVMLAASFFAVSQQGGIDMTDENVN